MNIPYIYTTFSPRNQLHHLSLSLSPLPISIAKSNHIVTLYFIVLTLMKQLVSIVGKLGPWTSNTSLPHEIFSLDISSKLHYDSGSIKTASSDYGNLVQEIPSAVLYPSSVNDIIDLVNFSYSSSVPFNIAPRGHGHSVRGQAMAKNGVVVEMSSLGNISGNGIRVSWSNLSGYYADVGGDQLWIDVLRTTMKHGLAPVSWTDYLYLTVGGTLSNAGISGQSFLHGPQISNVHELDVITGKGDFMTCSKSMNSELFYAVLGGLGQFGVITRARIVLDKTPKRVKWVRMLYNNFSAFTKDQEHLIAITSGFDYVEGSLILSQSPPNNWRSSFFSLSDQSKIASLLTRHDIIYCLEAVKYYDDLSIDTVDEEMEQLVKELSFVSGFTFKKDVSFVDFLNRVRSGELKLQSEGLWDVPHPWLNIFVPKSRIMDFNAGVFVDIISKQNITMGPLLVYPTTRKTWDDRMSAVIPDEDIFYVIGLLHSSGIDDDSVDIDDQNKEILKFCDESGIKIKQYLPHYITKDEWMKHFGGKWNKFQEMKFRFDPKFILSPGQKIFNSI